MSYELKVTKIATSLSVAAQRTGTELKDINRGMAIDIYNEFEELNENDIKKAIRNGSLGKYGFTYKLTTQVVCIWIREYLKENDKWIAE